MNAYINMLYDFYCLCLKDKIFKIDFCKNVSFLLGDGIIRLMNRVKGFIMTNNYTVSFDIGIGSVGWAIVDSDRTKLIEMGSRIFNSATPAQEARLNRSARRTQRRRKWREQQLLDAFDDFGIVPKDESKKEGYLSYTSKNFARPKPETIYHLRQYALEHPVSERELLLCLYNICKTRGHFLLESVNFERETVDFPLFKEKFYALTDDYVEFNSYDLKNVFETHVLNPIFDQNFKQNEIKKCFKEMDFGVNEKVDMALEQICYLIAGYKGDVSKISEDLLLLDENNQAKSNQKVKVLELLKLDQLNDFLNGIVELYDLINIANILKSYNYICELNVHNLEQVKKIYKLEKEDDKQYQEEVKMIQAKMSSVGDSKKRLRVVKNMDNKFPNGLYLKEAKQILKKQQETNPKITTEFIEICLGIIKTRIPYYIGPLDQKAKNAWLIKQNTFKYSYEYSKNQRDAVNEEDSIIQWKKNMISRCTYLPDEYALPKGSLLAEIFSIVNEMNILTAEDQDGNTYNLRQKDKIDLFNKLFLSKSEVVTYKEVREVLGLSKFGPKNGGYGTQFKNKITLYHQISKICPELKIHSIFELFKEKEKLEKIEEIILDITLFDEDLSKKEHFLKNGFTSEQASALSKLSSKGFYSFSKAFIFETGMDEQNKSLLDLLFEDNSPDFKNEQMTRIHQATDLNGNKIDFDANKYKAKLEQKNDLSIDLLMDEGKPFVPIARPVIRSLNECMKLYKEIIRIYGQPKRVVIETARDLKDSSRKGEVPAKHFDQMNKLYDYLAQQIKEVKKGKNKKLSKISNNMENWSVLESYLLKNKRKIEAYIRQNGQDLITGEIIDLNQLQDYELDHILPRGFGDNSMDNMMLIHRKTNGAKGNRVPLEYIEDGAVNSLGELITTSSFVHRVNTLFELKMISEKKKEKLLLSSSKEVEGFINRNLVDTRYIVKEFMAILKAYHDVNDLDTHVVALQAAFTDTYRHQGFKMRKNRELGVQHHAHDAAILAIVDKMLSTYYPNYDTRGSIKGYHDFLMNLKKGSKDNPSIKRFDRWTSIMYQKTFHEDMNDPNSLLSQVKSRVPLYSLKAEKNYKGQYFDATIYSQIDKKGKERKKGVLGILGVNNDKRIYSSINSVAVDFYKYTDAKGKKKHVAIHIPKVIVDADGNINKEKYIALIKKHYKAKELIDEQGELKTQYFRFRAFKNDLIYDSVNNELQVFNIGSVTNKKLDLKQIDIFSYDDLYVLMPFYKKSIIAEFNIKDYSNSNENAIPFKDINKEQLIDYCLDELMEIENRERYEKTIHALLEKETNLYSFIEKMSYLSIVTDRKNIPPTITGQFMPVAHSDSIKTDFDAQYIKLKYSILGVRFKKDDNGKLFIAGPNKAIQCYTKVRKEKFSWRICKEVIE